MSKICLMCKQNKPDEMFSKLRTSKDGLYPYCKECVSIKTAEYRRKHNEDIKRRKRESYERSKLRKDERTAKQLEQKTRVCSECGKEKSLETDFYKRGNGGFYSICKECHNIKMKEHTEKNYDAVIARKRQYHKDHKAEIDAYNKQYYLENTKDIKQRVRDWEINNPERVRENSVFATQRDRSRKAGLLTTLTKEEWMESKKYFSDEEGVHCAYCGKVTKRPTQDHIIPIVDGGTYTKGNIVPACKRCNPSKENHNFQEWFRKQDFYSKEREEKILAYIKEIHKAC